MEKPVHLLVVLLVSAVLLFGCSQPQQTGDSQQPGTNSLPTGANENTGVAPQQPSSVNQPTAKPTEPKPTETQSKDFSSLYSYSSLTSYEYRVTATSETGQSSVTNLKTKVSSDAYKGTPAWLTQTDMSTEGTSVMTKLWVDKKTNACLATKSVINYGGQTMENEAPCPTEGPNSASGTSGTESKKLKYEGIESVSVPAGTFQAEKYSIQGSYYWTSASVPIPVKMTYGTTKMELVSYS